MFLVFNRKGFQCKFTGLYNKLRKICILIYNRFFNSMN